MTDTHRHSVHDTFFREAFALPHHVGRWVVEAIGAQHLPRAQPDAARWLDTQTDGKQADRVLLLPRGDRHDLVLLNLEHQSTYDPNMPLRCAGYVVRALERWTETHGPADRPDGLCVVIHQGPRPWPAHRRARWLSSGSTPGAYPLDLRLHLIDLSHTPHAPPGTPADLAIALGVLRRARDHSPLAWLAQHAELLATATKQRTHRFTEALARYIAHVQPLEHDMANRHLDALAHTSSDFVRSVKTLAEHWHDEGKEEGREEGREEGQRATLVRLGTQRFGPPTVRQQEAIDAAPSATLLGLIDRLLAAQDWQDLLG